MHVYDDVTSTRRTCKKALILCYDRLLRCIRTERRPFAFPALAPFIRFTTATNHLLGVHKCLEHVYENIYSARLSLALVLLQR